MKRRMKIAGSALCLITSLSVFASELPQQVSDVELKQLIKATAERLQTDYVYPKTAEKMVKAINKHLTAGDYRTMKQPSELADQLTKDLQAISQDKHLRIIFDPKTVEEERTREADKQRSERIDKLRLQEMQQSNFGFKKQEILAGNIGYLKLDGFVDTAFAGDTAIAAMGYFANADALIVDLRENGGGSPSMIQLLSSYFFDDEAVQLNNFYYRPENETTQSWTLPFVPGKRRPEMPIYILTSGFTFSAAEEFSYNLQQLERATIVGETTGGGAHPGGMEIVTDRFLIWVPRGRAINPITKTNWEGVGVKPDIAVEREQALQVAHKSALEKLVTTNTDRASLYQWHLDSLQAEINPVKVTAELLQSYTGVFGPRVLTVNDGQLYYRRGDGKAQPLKAISEDTFMLPNVDYFRLKIIKENNKVIALKGLYDNGSSDYSAKSAE